MSSYTKGEIDAKLDALAARNETALAREVGALRNEMTEGFGNLNTSIARLETTINTSVGIFKFWVPIAVTISIALGTCIGGAVLAAIIKLLVPSH